MGTRQLLLFCLCFIGGTLRGGAPGLGLPLGFPGGAPKRLEGLADTAQREVWEETGLRVQVERLHGIFDSFVEGKSDHVALFVCRAAAGPQPVPISPEIVATGFFDLTALPPGTSNGTRRRLTEFLEQRQASWGMW